ncbi:MAG TPA: glycoside hydrolase family 5 protein [Clostridia bacterium]|nr:glycoside hydrolase family 5 protein [Clostridia bacterium]
MKKTFLQARNGDFYINDERVILRGFAVGSWMNFEHFMLRIPGTEKGIRKAFADVYGEKCAAAFFDDLLNYFLTESDFIFLKSIGINVLRLPFNYRHFEDDQKPGIYKSEGFRHIDRVLELCKKYNIYAILDLHTSPGGQNPDSHSGSETGTAMFWEDTLSQERMSNLWGYIAEKYKDEAIIAGFDILNEPSYVSNTAAFNDFFERSIQKIRTVDSNHILFLEGDDWAKDFSLFNNLGGYQQALSFHFYPGQHVCLCTDSCKRKKEMEDKISRYVQLRDKTGMPLWVGETGGRFPKDRMSEGLDLIKDCLEIFEKHGISWTIWTYKDARSMGLVYPKEHTEWMKMGNEFRPKWQVKEKRNETFAREVLEMIKERFSYPIDEDRMFKNSFRISAILDELHIDFLVKPKLQSIPWNEMKDYPKAFLWENCDYWSEMAEALTPFFKSGL